MYAATANGTAAMRVRAQPRMTASRPKVATNSLTSWPMPWRAWRDALKSDEVHTKTELEWDTAALPEGKYRVRVEASDEPANPPDQVQKHALESEAVLVDNTPPRIENLQIVGRRLRAHVVDGTSPIARVEIAVDGKLEWRPVAAADGIYDTTDENVDADVSVLVGARP